MYASEYQLLSSHSGEGDLFVACSEASKKLLARPCSMEEDVANGPFMGSSKVLLISLSVRVLYLYKVFPPVTPTYRRPWARTPLWWAVLRVTSLYLCRSGHRAESMSHNFFLLKCLLLHTLDQTALLSSTAGLAARTPFPC